MRQYHEALLFTFIIGIVTAIRLAIWLILWTLRITIVGGVLILVAMLLFKI